MVVGSGTFAGGGLLAIESSFDVLEIIRLKLV